MSRFSPAFAALLTIALLPASAWPQNAPSGEYRADVESWRQKREERLMADGGWLTVSGLFWLKTGNNRMGSDPAGEIVLPAPAPAQAAVIAFDGDTATLRVRRGVEMNIEGISVTQVALRPDTSGSPQVIKLGPIWFHMIERQGRMGIRVKDMNSKRRREFKGLAWYPVDSEHRVVADFVPHDVPQKIEIANVVGQIQELSSPGYVVFTIDGQEVRLHPLLDPPDSQAMFFIFRDGTSAKTTYGAGRFLYSPRPQADKVVLDFNKAYSPPCAFTDFATCPLPPPQNRLSVPIEAGEKAPSAH